MSEFKFKPKDLPFGAASAYADAKEAGKANMTISCELVVELVDQLENAQFMEAAAKDGEKMVLDHIDEVRDENATLRQQLQQAEARADHCEREARQWRQEARTQSSIVAEIYQELTGKTGEPGDWNGARPIKSAILRKQAEALIEFGYRYGPESTVRRLTQEDAQRLIAEADQMDGGEG